MPKNKALKYVLLVGDGMGDLPIPELDGKTPLEAAETPTMDHLAGHGELYLLRTVPPGYPPGSDVANLSLLGYLPHRCYSGRAPLEAASMGVSLGDDAIAFRCNLVTLEKDAHGRVRMKDYSAGHIGTDEAKILIQDLDRELGSDTIRFYAGVSYRHLMVHQGALRDIATVPPHDYTDQDVTRFWQRYLAVPAFKSLMPAACALLDGHKINRERRAKGENPANAVWLWGEGKAPSMPTFAEQYGISGALISAVDLLKGIGVYAGLSVVNVPGATGYLDTNYAGKAAAALKALQDKDFVLVHVEAPDEASHQGLRAEKIRAIEDFDRRIVKPVLDGLQRTGEDFRLVVAMDHFTPLSTRTHSDQPVPFLLYDSRKKSANGPLFNEKNAAATGKLLENGRQFMELLLER